jgi:hypothetical protein
MTKSISTFSVQTVVRLGMTMEAVILFYDDGSNEIRTFHSTIGVNNCLRRLGLETL